MRVVRTAMVLGAIAVLCSESVATELAFVAPFDLSAPESGLDALSLSHSALGVLAVLHQADDGGDPIEKAVLGQLRLFYEARGFEPFWLADRVATPRMLELRRRMDQAGADGLDPARYATPNLARMYPDDPALLAAADVGFSRAVARFVTHLAAGRFDPAGISRIITLQPEHPDAGEALQTLARSTDVAKDISRYEPPHPEYQALKAELARRAEGGDSDAAAVVPDGPSLRPGGADPRMPLLRARLGLSPDHAIESEAYDPALVEGVKAFQEKAGLTADGVVGLRTIAALNGPGRAEDVAAIVANLERWRWMPRHLGAFHVIVNVPEFTLLVRRDGAVVHQTRTVVGSPDNPTPTFTHAIDHLVVNPYWNVPASIVANEMLPAIRRNPAGFFARRGYQVLARNAGRARVVDPNSVDWSAAGIRSVYIRQRPGDSNALGRIKFMFPNQHSVYLHDTPSKALFRRDYRAHSHGCVRVDNPLDFADSILKSAAPGWNSARLEKLYGGPERRIDLDAPVPVHLAYFTRAVDADGALRRFDDIYGYDLAMRGEPIGRVAQASLSP